ncbi:unnamed protein product [Orchesella dallaii]|uniref:Retrovirus-related Pol polyprotein from transposon TNT 1-94-like beta-barrel domain-containing protein n=1 Tax=Orchesella dallaii TaxID=48710 RepID=A0ABP1S087_9HEXA
MAAATQQHIMCNPRITEMPIATTEQMMLILLSNLQQLLLNLASTHITNGIPMTVLPSISRAVMTWSLMFQNLTVQVSTNSLVDNSAEAKVIGTVQIEAFIYEWQVSTICNVLYVPGVVNLFSERQLAQKGFKIDFLYGKEKQLPFPSIENRIQCQPGDIIHADLSGQQFRSLGGDEFFLLILDEVSTLRKAYYLKKNSETTACIKTRSWTCRDKQTCTIKYNGPENLVYYISNQCIYAVNIPDPTKHELLIVPQKKYKPSTSLPDSSKYFLIQICVIPWTSLILSK